MKTKFNNAQEIRDAVDAGHTVCWSHDGYRVIKDNAGQYLVHCLGNNHCVGLTWQDNVTLNGKLEDFFIRQKYYKIECFDVNGNREHDAILTLDEIAKYFMGRRLVITGEYTGQIYDDVWRGMAHLAA